MKKERFTKIGWAGSVVTLVGVLSLSLSIAGCDGGGLADVAEEPGLTLNPSAPITPADPQSPQDQLSDIDELPKAGAGLAGLKFNDRMIKNSRLRLPPVGGQDEEGIQSSLPGVQTLSLPAEQEGTVEGTGVAPTLSLGEDEVDLAWVGGIDGNNFKLSCSKDEFVSKIVVKSGDAIGRICIGCKKLNGLGYVEEKGCAGVNGGDTFEYSPLEFAFTGYNAASGNGNGRTVVTLFQPVAKKMNGLGVNEGVQWSGKRLGRGSTDYFYEYFCPDGWVLTGFNVQASGVVEGMQGVCKEVLSTAQSSDVSYSLGRSVYNPADIYKTSDANGARCDARCDEDYVVVGFMASTGSYTITRKDWFCDWCDGDDHYTALEIVALECAKLDFKGINMGDKKETQACGNLEKAFNKETFLNPGFFATGFFGRTGGRVFQLGLISQPFDAYDDDPFGDLVERGVTIGADSGTKSGDFKCDDGQALTGIRFKSGSQVDSIEGYYCAPITNSTQQ